MIRYKGVLHPGAHKPLAEPFATIIRGDMDADDNYTDNTDPRNVKRDAQYSSMSRIFARQLGWTQWSTTGTDDHGLRGWFPRGIKASARMPSPRTGPMTR